MGFLDRFRRTTRRHDSTTTTVLPGAWGNAISGLGVSGIDPTRSLSYGAGRIPSAQTIDRLLTFDWLAMRIVELLPRIAMVRGFTPVSEDGTGATDAWKAFRRLNYTARFPRGAFEHALNQGRGHGGAVLLRGYALGNPASELTPTQAAGGLNFLDVFAQHELRVLTRFDDPREGNYRMPELYEVIAGCSGPPHPRTGQIFHSSRATLFSGYPLRVPNTSADLIGEGPEVGVSVLVPVLNVLAQYGLAWSALSNLLQDASIGVLKLSGLVDALSSEDDTILQDRLTVLAQTKAAHRLMFLDADNQEEFSRTEVRMTDVPQMIQQFMTAVAGAAGVPARVFFSSSPTGLNANASGNSDLAQFYAECEDLQNTQIGPKLEGVLTDANNGVPVSVTWPSLWAVSDNEKAQTRVAEANADKVFWDMGFGAGQIAAARARGTRVELTGDAPEDARDDVQGSGQTEPPDGAPGAQQASNIATNQRATEST